jgi:hypothetical protein
MSDEATCGKGLAANATLPAAAGELFRAMAHLLDVHQRALDLTDEKARPEHAAYATVAQELRNASSQLTAIAERMAGYHDLPMGRHDERQMAGRAAFDAFEQFVQSERTLVSLLSATTGEHESMLGQMRAASQSSSSS